MCSEEVSKKCGRCGKIKPLTDFARNASKSSGYGSWCKSCHRDYSAKRARQEKSIPKTKKCPKCGVCKGAAEYSKSAYSTDGLASWCKGCSSTYYAQYMKRPGAKEAHRVASEKYRASEKGRATIKQYNYRYNRDPQVKKRRNALRATEKYRQTFREWARRNKEKIRANGRRRKARERNAPGNHTGEDILHIYNSQRGRCWYCQQEIALDDMHVDHRVPLSRGGSNNPDNLVVTCAACNLSKNKKLPHEWCGRLL